MRQSKIDRALGETKAKNRRGDLSRMYGVDDIEMGNLADDDSLSEVDEMDAGAPSPIGCCGRFCSYLRLEGLKIVFILFFIGINIWYFADGFLKIYDVDEITDNVGAAVAVAKACGALLRLNSLIILLLVSR